MSRTQKPVTGRQVLYVLLAMFGVVLLVNGIFLYFALSTHPGETVGDAYNKGLRYNQTLANADEQRALGWKHELRFTQQGARTGDMEIQLNESSGTPVAGLKIEAMIRRPADSSHDRVIKFATAKPGLYRARLQVPLSGNWDLHITARRDNRPVYRLEHRLWMD